MSFALPQPKTVTDDEVVLSREDWDAIVRILGEPTQKNAGPVVTVYHWQDDLAVTVRTDISSVTQICAVSPDYATAKGLRPGLPETAPASRPVSSAHARSNCRRGSRRDGLLQARD